MAATRWTRAPQLCHIFCSHLDISKPPHHLLTEPRSSCSYVSHKSSKTPVQSVLSHSVQTPTGLPSPFLSIKRRACLFGLAIFPANVQGRMSTHRRFHIFKIEEQDPMRNSTSLFNPILSLCRTQNQQAKIHSLLLTLGNRTHWLILPGSTSHGLQGCQNWPQDSHSDRFLGRISHRRPILQSAKSWH
jgi:hypothetical protein